MSGLSWNNNGVGFQAPVNALTAGDLNWGSIAPMAGPVNSVQLGVGNGLTAPTSYLSTPQIATANPLAGLGGNQNNNGMGFGMNLPTFQLGLGAVNSLGNLWQAWNASKLAKQQLNLTRDVTNTNLNNSIKEYNTALADRAYNRAAMAGAPASSAQDYINQHSLSR